MGTAWWVSSRSVMMAIRAPCGSSKMTNPIDPDREFFCHLTKTNIEQLQFKVYSYSLKLKLPDSIRAFI